MPDAFQKVLMSCSNGVAFIEPKRSTGDIIQAVGRAIVKE